MVAIFTGLGAGLVRSSVSSLGSPGVLGSGALGRGGENVSVNAANGNLLVSQQDEFLAGRGLDVAIGRTYNSQAQTSDRDNGDNWQMGTTRRVLGLVGTLNTAGSTVQRLSGDGSLVTYTYAARLRADGTSESAYWTTDGDGAHEKLVKSGSNWVWTDGSSQVTETYTERVAGSGEWRIVSQTDTAGYGLTFTYNTGGDLLDKVTDANGEWVQYAWSGNQVTQLITGTSSGTLTRTRYAYNGAGKLSSVTVDLSPADNSVADGKVYTTSYLYDGAGRLNQVQQTGGTQVDVVYDANGRVTSITQQVGPSDTRVTSLGYYAGYTLVTGPDGQVTRLDFDTGPAVTDPAMTASMDLTTWSTVGLSRTAAGTINGAAAYQYTSTFAAGQATYVQTNPQVSVQAGQTYSWEVALKGVGGFDQVALGLLGSVTGWGNNAEASFEIVSGPGTIGQWVGGLGSISGLSATQSTRIRITKTFTSNETISAVIYPDYGSGNRTGAAVVVADPVFARRTPTNQLTKITAPPAYAGAAAQVVQFAYDADGNLLSVTAPNGKVTNRYYDTQGNLIKEQDPNTVGANSHFKRWYDAGNRVVAERTYGAGATTMDVVAYAQFVYDAAGHLRYSVSGEGRVTEYRYDGYGQLQWRVDYPEHLYTAAYTEGSITSEATMNTWRDGIADRQSTKITYYSYDARGNLSSELDYGYATNVGGSSTAEGYSRTWFTYDRAGRLIERHNENEISETFVYDDLGRLVSSVDLNGGTTSVVFNDAALQTIITTAAGYTTTQSYDKAGGLVSATGSGTFDVTATPLYKYDKLGRVRMATDATGLVTYFIYDKAGRKVGEVNGYGQLTEYRYDAANRLIAEARYANAIAGSYLTQLADPNNTLEMATVRPAAHAYDIWSWTVYDAGGRMIQSIDGAGGVVAYEYDYSDRLIRTTSYATKVAVSAFAATPPTAPVTVTPVAADTVSRVFYDRDGNLIGTLDGEGYLVEHIYDKAGQKVEDVAYTTRTSSSYWASGTFDQLRTSAGSSARRTRYTYDGQGLLRYAIDALGRVTSYSYDATGKLTATRAHAATITPADYTYDAVKAAVTSGANDRLTTLTYDTRGRVATSTDATGTVTSFTYDIAGRVIKVQVGTGAGARITRNWYSASGLLRFTADAENYLRRYDYDAENRKVREFVFGTPVTTSDSTTIAQVNSLAPGDWIDRRYEYDAAGRLSSQYDGENNRTLFTYYASGQLASTYEAYGTPDERVTIYVYDGAGQLVTEYDRYGDDTQAGIAYAYDGLGNRTSVTDGRGYTTTYTYDEVGQVKTVTNAAGGITTYTYDAFGAVVQVTDPRNATTITAYNAVGQATQVTDALSYVTTYAYTAFNEVLSVTRAGATTSFEYDKLSRVTKSTDALGFYEAYTYDAWGNRVSARNKLGGITSYAYDRRGLLTSETLPVASINSAGTTVASTVTNTYSYDARGNRLTMVEAAGLAEARTTSYTYSATSRLLSTSGPAFFGMTPVTSVLYDARGNVTRSVDPTGARTVYYYNDLDQVAVEISAVGTYTAYTYDVNGNVTVARVYATAVAIPADGGAKAEAPGAPSGAWRETTFAYDPLNRMTSSSIAGVTSGTFNGSSWVADTSAIVTGYLYDANGNVTKATDAQLNATWSWYDLLGRKTHQLDGEGYLTAWTYDAEGNVLTERRYATKFTGTPVVGTPPSLGTAADDRLTSFAYDLVGNRLSEARSGVMIHDGAGGYTTVTATVAYLYNGLGQVTRKTEATGDQVNYTYDAAGRLTTEARATFVDQSGTAVTPTVDYYYDGVGQLSRTRARGSANAAERVTTYGYYGAKLYWMRDAEAQDGEVTNGKLTYYYYDAAGRETYQYYQRWDAAGNVTATYEGLLTAYDAAGRVTQKWQATYNGSSWVDAGPRAATAYNAYGEVVSLAVGGVTQAQNVYDAAGRMTATTAGDGVWKFFGYDKNGNQTVAIASAGANFSSQTFAGALALVGQADVNATYTQYDKRGMAVTVTEEGRQLSVGGTAQVLVTTRNYTAFGEAAAETNALGATITYTYNTMGRLIKSESPLVSITLENGTTANVRPTEQYYYDVSGRLVASRDANANLTRLTLLAGSGYGGGQALATAETHADGGVKTTKYDIHGDARELTDELGHKILQTFNAMGRITTRLEQRNAGTTADDYTDTYVWDGLGQQLKHGSNAYSTPTYGDPYWVTDGWDPYTYEEYGHWETPITGYTPDYEVTNYDISGRVTYKRAYGGDVTTVAYAWDGSLTTSGVGTFGGYTQTTTMANGLVSVQKSDLAGRAIAKTDLGGHATVFSYDAAGRMASTAMGGMVTSFVWLNAGFLGRMTVGSADAGQYNTNWTRDVATYGYDAVGNRTSELLQRDAGYYTPGGWYYPYGYYYDPEWQEESYYEYTTVLKNQSATYDALGRMRTWAEAGTATSPAASIANEYDAAGNVRRTNSSWRALNAQGTAASSASARDYWFRYDAMNRVVVNQGTLTGGAIVRGDNSYGAGGQEIAYDAAGRRTSVLTTTGYWDYYSYYYYTYDTKELYNYDDAGRVIETRQLDGTGATGPGTLRSSYGYDLAGRQISQSDYAANGSTVIYSRSAGYDAAGRLASDYSWTKKTDNKTYTSSTTYNYGSGSGYMLGAVVSQSGYSSVSGSGGSTTYNSTTNGYVWYDGALQSSISYKPNTSQSTTWTTTMGYDGLGRLTSAYIADGKPHSVTFTNDELGQIVRRDETQVSGQTGAPHEAWYRYTGRQLGYTGNNGTSQMAMAASIADRQVTAPTNQGTFRNKQMYGSAYADFAQNYDPINSFSQGGAGGSYQVQRGDTLQSIAQATWGDSSLWYKLAEANGLGASSALLEGQRLTLPTGVQRTHNSAKTSKPYDPASAIGDLSPGTAPKPKGNKCGTFGFILLAVIAIAVTVATAGAAVAALGPAGTTFASGLSTVLGTGVFGGTVLGSVASVAGAAGAIAIGAASAAIGSAVSQGVGLALGIQDKFSWKGVALAAIGGGVGGALGPGGYLGGEKGLFSGLGSVAGTGLRAAASSAISQGIGLATGLQSKFSFVGVAAAGIGAAAGAAIGDQLAGGGIFGLKLGSDSLGNFAISSSATLLANAATRSALEGSSFGDNIMAALPDTLASILFRAIGKAANPVQRPAVQIAENPVVKVEYMVIGGAVGPLGMMLAAGEIPIPTVRPDHGKPVSGLEGDVSPAQARAAAAQWRSAAARDPDYRNASQAWIPYWEAVARGERPIVPMAVLQSENGSGGGGTVNTTVSGSGGSGGSSSSVENFLSGVGSVISDIASGLQWGLDKIAGGLNTAIDWVVDRYQEGRDFEDRLGMGNNPVSLGGDFVMGAVSELAKGVPGTISVISHPQESLLGLAGAIDRVFLDDTPARVHLANAYNAVTTSSPRQLAFNGGRVASYFVPAGAASKVGSVRALGFAGREGAVIGRVERAVGDVSYARPSGYRVGVRDQVWDNAVRNSGDGFVRDPLTDRIMSKGDPWDMGHLPGQEFRRIQGDARAAGISRKEFLDHHNNPLLYRPELPSSNRSHALEDFSLYF